MSEPVHISVAIANLLSRDGLPDRVLDTHNGRILVWSDDDRAYRSPDSLYIWPSFIRSLWGSRFQAAEIEHVEEQLEIAL